MKNKKAGTFQKVLRTIGYVLVLLSSLFFITKIMATNTELTLLSPFLGITEPINEALKFLNDYIAIVFAVGFLLIVFVIRSKFTFILMLIVTIAIIIFPAAELRHLFGVELTNLSFIPNSLDDIIASNKFIGPIFLVLVAAFLNLALRNKKPKRFSLFWYGIGTTILIVTTILSAVKIEEVIGDMGLGFPITGYLFIIIYALFSVGSVFGILGFSKD